MQDTLLVFHIIAAIAHYEFQLIAGPGSALAAD